MDGGGSWYVSWQGKVQGPLPWPTLQELARLGRLKPEMLLGQDRQAWRPAGEFDSLFASQSEGGDFLGVDLVGTQTPPKRISTRFGRV